MKKLVFIFSILLISKFSGAQSFKAGIRFMPLDSYYYMHDLMDIHQNSSFSDNIEFRNDSLTIGIFIEKYFIKKSFLARLDFNFANLNLSESESSIETYNNGTYVFEYAQNETQKFYNLNLGIGNRIELSKFLISFGIFVPLTYLPEGNITRDVSQISNGVLESVTTCSGKYAPALGYGIGSFAGVSTVILKHLSLGADFTYQIQYLSRKLDWHGETQYYSSGTP